MPLASRAGEPSSAEPDLLSGFNPRCARLRMRASYLRVVTLVIIAGLSIGSRSSVLRSRWCLAPPSAAFCRGSMSGTCDAVHSRGFWLSRAYCGTLIKTMVGID